MELPSKPASTSSGRDPLNLTVRSQDAQTVADRVFQDFGLSIDEVNVAAETLAGVSGGVEFQRILDAAARKSGASWETVPRDRRDYSLNRAMLYHGSPADLERMALRTGGGLFLTGTPELGRKILEAAPDSGFGTEPMNVRMGMVIAQLGLYSFMIGVIAIQSVESGVYLYLVPGIAAVAVAALLVWVYERGRMKLKREEGEATRYLAALGRISQGAPPAQVFGPDGELAAPGAA